MQGYLILALIFALLVAVFAVQNAAAVDIRFLNWAFSGISLVLVILGSAAGGAIFAFLLGAPKQFGMYRRLREAQAQVRKLQEELEQVKSAKPAETPPVGAGEQPARGTS